MNAKPIALTKNELSGDIGVSCLLISNVHFARCQYRRDTWRPTTVPLALRVPWQPLPNSVRKRKDPLMVLTGGALACNKYRFICLTFMRRAETMCSTRHGPRRYAKQSCGWLLMHNTQNTQHFIGAKTTLRFSGARRWKEKKIIMIYDAFGGSE